MRVLVQQGVSQRLCPTAGEEQVGKLTAIAPVPLYEGNHRGGCRIQSLAYLRTEILLSPGGVEPRLPLAH
jgi:hypothetical protein